MKPITKIGIVVGGYVAAIALAALAAIFVFYRSGPDARAASGMSAFGDMIFVLAVFGFASLFPTGAALFFLRPYRRFWQVISIIGFVIALTSIGAAILCELGRNITGPSPLATWVGFAIFRLLAAPLFALFFSACAALSSHRTPRLTFVAATLIEAASIVYMAATWFGPHTTRL